jgi:DNA-binding NarL/FixJ family response regulator
MISVPAYGRHRSTQTGDVLGPAPSNDRSAETRVVVADPVTMFRSGVRNVLGREREFTVVEAGNLEELIDVAVRSSSDIALIDLDLPPRGGIYAIQRLSEVCSVRTILWSFAPGRKTVLEAIRAGATGYLHKELAPTGLVRSLRGIEEGQAPLSRDLTALLIDGLHGLDELERVHARAQLLSPREREVLDLVAQGARNKQIASALYISEFTVKRHMQNILEKLELPSRRAAAAFYRSAFDSETAIPAVGGRA